jgi:hypothetical protein
MLDYINVHKVKHAIVIYVNIDLKMTYMWVETCRHCIYEN